MRIQRHIYFLSIIILFFNYAGIFSAEVLPGNSATSDTSFSFPIQEHVFDERTGNFFVAASPQAGGAEQVKDFAVSVALERNRYKFEPLTPQAVRVNGVDNVQNPLFDAGITHIGLIAGDVIEKQTNPVVVKTNEPARAYLFQTIAPPHTGSLVASQYILDSHGGITSGIVGLSHYAPDHVFAAVKPHASDVFGQVGSGIAVLLLGYRDVEVTETKNKDQKSPEKKDADAKQQDKKPESTAAKSLEGAKKTMRILTFGPFDASGESATIGKALPFDITIDQLKIGNDLASMGQIVDIHWDSMINRLYIAIQITTGSQATDGGRALVVGRVEQTSSTTGGIKRKLILEKIAPDQAFTTDQNNIVGTLGANAQVSLHKVRTLFTSTGLHAVVVVGGNGDADTTKRSVYALPVVNNSSRPANNGVLAIKNAIPTDEFRTGKQGVPDMFIGRSVKQPALTQNDMFVTTDVAARVGAGDLEAGDITDIFVRGDAVFVTVETPADPNELPGIFYSQAIFNELGMIKAWTAWRRAAGTTNQIFGGAFTLVDGNFLFMTNDVNNTVNTVKRTVWNNGAQNGLLDLNKVVTQELPMNTGGIQGFVDLPANAPGLHDISLMMMTGKNKVVLAESGQVINNVLHPLQGSFAQNSIPFTNGTITTTLPVGVNNPKVVSITGGALDDIGPLTTATIARDGDMGNNGFLFVGGINGLAILSAANGDGWNTAIGLGPDFAGLATGMSFKIIPGYTLVRKLILDENFLYVLTDTKLDRIDLTQGAIGLGQVEAVTVATHTTLVGPSGFFSDCIVSGKFAVIATSRGLLRVGNGKDIRLAANGDETGWTSIPMPEGVKGVRQIYAMSKTGMPHDVARNDGGQMYALNVDRGTDRSDITRFAVNAVDRSPIDDNTITPFPDFYIKGLHSYRMNFGALKTVFATDGALYLSGHGIDLEMKPAVTFPRNFIGSRFVGVQNQAYIPLALDGGSHITNITRSFACGSWLISGDFGLRINE